MKRFILLFAFLFVFSSSFISCREEGPVEEGVEEVGEDFEEGVEEVDEEF